jgi:hypothetical protein
MPQDKTKHIEWLIKMNGGETPWKLSKQIRLCHEFDLGKRAETRERFRTMGAGGFAA